MTAFDPAELVYQAPLLLLILTGLLLVLGEAFAVARRGFLMRIAVAGCVLAAAAAVWVWRDLGAGAAPRPLVFGMLQADRFGTFFTLLVCAATAATAMLSGEWLREHDTETGEYYGLLLLSAAGMVMLVTAADLATIFLGVETMSLGVYVLTASRRRSPRSAEGGMKYFLTGAFATGVLLYGIALVYGAAGTTNLDAIADLVHRNPSSPLLVVGVFMLLAAFAFKVSAVPFHMWAPDAYEGAPTPITGFMASAVKASAFAALLRVFAGSLSGDVMPYGRMGWASIWAVLAAITMTVGNLAALRQENVKRMLAYSSIAHAGTILVGVVATGVGADAAGRAAVAYYAAAYTVTTLGAFGVVAWVGSRDHERLLVDDWAGLGARHPAAALAMTIFLLSLGGIPPTSGFFAKFYVFRAAMQAYDQQLLWLVVIGVLNSVISIFYYLRLVTAMYFREPLRDHSPLRSPTAVAVLVACAILVLEMGMFSSFWIGLI